MRDPLKLRVKRPKKAKNRGDTKESHLDRNLVYITRKISRGDFNPESKSDMIMAKVARSKGIIDENYNILKEEYLLCKTKRTKS